MVNVKVLAVMTINAKKKRDAYQAIAHLPVIQTRIVGPNLFIVLMEFVKTLA